MSSINKEITTEYELYLPVSVGEALDKLTILDIKLNRIKDNRRNNVKIEYDILYEKLKTYIETNKKYYNMLKKTNDYIWDLMDLLRDGININDLEYTKLCKDTITANDVRFRIKDKINILSNSHIKEQKGYKTLKVLVDLTNYNGNHELLIKPLYYYFILYDEIYVRTDDKLIVNFIINEYGGMINIINVDDKTEENTTFLKTLVINNNYNINDNFGITDEDINRFL